MLIRRLDLTVSEVQELSSVSLNWQSCLWGGLIKRALLFGVYIRAPDFWKLPAKLVGNQGLPTRRSHLLVGSLGSSIWLN